MTADALRARGNTRERILEVAETAVLEKGFAATSIEELIAAVGITKGGFFYHFRDKGELAKPKRVSSTSSSAGPTS
jgi:AcrR family transcriptional regulator